MSERCKSSTKRNGCKTKLDKILRERKCSFPLLIKESKTGDQTGATKNDPNEWAQKDEDGNQGSDQDDMSVPKTSKRSSLADLLGQTYAAGAAKKLKTAEDQAKEEMTRYKEEAPLSLGVNPLDWWKEREGQYPFLSIIAKRYLCIPGTSVSSERVFSTAGDIITAQRSVLTPDHLDQILFLNKNLKRK